MIVSAEERHRLLNGGTPVSGWYVYGWVNEDWNGAYFYIGKGRGKRYADTEKRGLAFKAIYKNWSCFPVILEDGLTESEAEIREAEIKERMIFERGYPIMDGEGHSSTLKHLAGHYAKKKKREADPNWHEGRKAMEIHPEFDVYREKTGSGELTVVEACAEMGISRSTWYKWTREMAG